MEGGLRVMDVKLQIIEGELRYVCKHCASVFYDRDEIIEHPRERPTSFINILKKQDTTIDCKYAGLQFKNPLKNIELVPYHKEPIKFEKEIYAFPCEVKQSRV